MDMYLSCSICNRGHCNLCHPMNMSITRACSFRFLLNRAWWCKDMLICLSDNAVRIGIHKCKLCLPRPESRCAKAPSMDLQGHICSPCTKRLAIDPQAWYTCHYAVSPSPWEDMSKLLAWRNAVHSGSDQFRLAGHSRNPVFSWLNLWSNLTLRAMGGERGSLRGTIQSKTVLFRLFVSSDLVLKAPFCSFRQVHMLSDRTLKRMPHQIRNYLGLFDWAIDQALF